MTKTIILEKTHISGILAGMKLYLLGKATKQMTLMILMIINIILLTTNEN